jgi:hypothetical protein
LCHNPEIIDKIIPPDAPPEEIAKYALYRYSKDGKEEIGLPTRILFACLKNAGTMESITWYDGKKKKITVGSRTKGKGDSQTSVLGGILRIKDPYIPLQPNQWIIDKRKVRNPITRGMIEVIRPCFEKWGFKVEVEYDEILLPDLKLLRLFELGGRWFGLGAYRVELGGPFGQFKVVKWEKV